MSFVCFDSVYGLKCCLHQEIVKPEDLCRLFVILGCVEEVKKISGRIRQNLAESGSNKVNRKESHAGLEKNHLYA